VVALMVRNLRTAAEPLDEDVDELQDGDRDRNEDLAGDEDVATALRELYSDIEQGFQEQSERAEQSDEYWDIYHCKLGSYQYYSGTSKIYLPIVHNAVNARVTRFINQIFPVSGRYVEVISANGEQPHGIMSLAEHYVRKAKLRTKVLPALMRNGDVEGQYNCYVSWQETSKHVTWRVYNEVGEATEVLHRKIQSGHPIVEVLADCDVLILPFTSESVEDALENGGSVTVVRRWTAAKIRRKMRDGEIDEEAGEGLLQSMGDKKAGMTDKQKEMIKAAGIKNRGKPKAALIFETWTKLLIDDEWRLCCVLYGGPDLILGCKRNWNWSDDCPVISVPVDKVEGSTKGVSKVKPCAQPQYFANDVVNEAADSAMYALCPIVMTDPNKNPRVGSMVLSMSAVWEVDPGSTQFARFPEVWKDGFQMVSAAKGEITQTLNVSPAAITPAVAGRVKKSQAEVAQEQQVDILTTADAVTVLEEGVLTPIINRFIKLDHQFRDEEALIPIYGQMGKRAMMERVPPIQLETRYHFKWLGVEAARNAQQMQQQIAMLNVLRGIPPQLYGNKKLSMEAAIAQLVENTFGPRIAALTFQDQSEMMPIPPDQENMLLVNGFETPVSPMDDDNLHIQSHMRLLQTPGAGNMAKVKTHLFLHMQQQQKKIAAAAMQAQAQMQPGLPGAPGGAGPGLPGQPAGGPRIGAQPGAQRLQGPPGMLSPDQIGPMSGGMPRLRNGAAG
jgi:hypothetical protein